MFGSPNIPSTFGGHNTSTASTSGLEKHHAKKFQYTPLNLDFELQDSVEDTFGIVQEIEYSTILPNEVEEVDFYSDDEDAENFDVRSYENMRINNTKSQFNMLR